MVKPRLILSFGISIWIVIFFLVSIFLDWYEHYDFVKYLILLVAFIIAFSLTRALKTSKLKEALIIGIAWALLSFLLDLIITSSYDPMIFSSSFSWLYYGSILIAPLIACLLSKSRR